MATSAQINGITSLYVGYFNRAPDPAGLNFWIDELDKGRDYNTIAADFAASPEAKALYPYLATPDVSSPGAFLTSVYNNLFNRAPDQAGLDFWTDVLESGSVTVADMIEEIILGAQGDDKVIMDNKVEAGLDWAETLANVPGFKYVDADGKIIDSSEAAARAAIADVDATDASVDAAKAATDAYAAGFGGAPSGDGTLTVNVDNLMGSDGDDVFEAPLAQNDLGAVTNTFESGDTIKGGEGMDRLNADLTHTVSGSIPVGPAISATTDSVEHVHLRQQANIIDTGGAGGGFLGLPLNGSVVDAENMSGVKQWWTDNSRSNIQVEDIRSAPRDTAFGMNETDPYAGFAAFVNANYLTGDVDTTSTLTLTIQELDGGAVDVAAELANITVNSVTFELAGTEYSLTSDAIKAANTWDALEAAMADAIAGNAALAGLVIDHAGEGVFTLTDDQGRDMGADPATAVLLGFTGIDVRNRVEVGQNVEHLPTETDVYLDDVGNGSQGGILNIAAMSGERGIEVMNLMVDDDSHLSTVRSLNRGGLNEEEQLEVINVKRGNADGTQDTGTLRIGQRTIDDGGEETTVDGRLTTAPGGPLAPGLQGANGLQNVRVFNAEGFDARVEVAAHLRTEDVFDKYLDPAGQAEAFTYHMGDAGSNLSLMVDGAVSSDDEFMLNLIGGDGEDRFNIRGLDDKTSTTIDGEEGEDTVEVTTSITAANAWKSFDNVETLVVAGTGDSNIDVATIDVTGSGMDSLERVIIETDDDGIIGDDTTLQNMNEDMDVVISGAAQTLNADNNNNADQFFGFIDIESTQAVPDVTTQNVQLNNTARTDGELIVSSLSITNPEPGVDNITIHSNGRNQTSNSVNSVNAAALSTIMLAGTQDLNVHVTTLAGVGAATIDGSDMDEDADLTLSVNATRVLNNGAADRLIGGPGDNDELQLIGDVSTNPTISGFETIQFGDPFNGLGTAATGVFDASNVTDVETYEIDRTNFVAPGNPDFGIENLRGDETIRVNTDLNDVNGSGVTFTFLRFTAASGNNNTLDLTFEDLNPATFEGTNAFEISTDGFGTINTVIDDDQPGVANFYDLRLRAMDNDGQALNDVGYDADEVDARVWNVSGGGAEDRLDMRTVSNVLTTIDFSEYEGSVLGNVGGTTPGLEIRMENTAVVDRNVTVKFNDQGAFVREFANGADDAIVEYEFTGDNNDANGEAVRADNGSTAGIVNMTEAWSIRGFEDFGGSGISDLSILDLSALGVTGLADLQILDETDAGVVDITGDGAMNDLVIVANDPAASGNDFVIVLHGLGGTTLNNENFDFA